MPIIKIVEGIDRIGKTTSLQWLKSFYESKGFTTIILHEKIRERKTLKNKAEFDYLRKNIEDLHEKEMFSYDAYAYLMQIMFETGVDVILIDRLHLTTKTYADVYRPNGITNVFGTLTNYLNYINIFELQLQRMSDVELLCFVKSNNGTYEDDNLDPLWLHKAEDLIRINEQFKHNFEFSNLKKQMFICEPEQKPDGSLFYNTLEQLKRHIQNAKA